MTTVGDGSVTANFAVYTELFSFSRLKLLFLQLGTKVPSA